ncbi:hypothetical protein [Pseudoxanthomonas suwonensis]
MVALFLGRKGAAIVRFWKVMKDAAVFSRMNDERLHALALAEVESGVRRDGLWAKAMIEGQGDPTRSRAAYLRLLVITLRDEQYLVERLADGNGPARGASPWSGAAEGGQDDVPMQPMPMQPERLDDLEDGADSAAQLALDQPLAGTVEDMPIDRNSAESNPDCSPVALDSIDREGVTPAYKVHLTEAQRGVVKKLKELVHSGEATESTYKVLIEFAGGRLDRFGWKKVTYIVVLQNKSHEVGSLSGLRNYFIENIFQVFEG